jgi:guanylate kinase
MKSSELLIHMNSVYTLCNNGFATSAKKLIDLIISIVSQEGLEPSLNQTASAIYFDKVENYLKEVFEQADAGDFLGAKALLRSIQGDIMRCGILEQNATSTQEMNSIQDRSIEKQGNKERIICLVAESAGGKTTLADAMAKFGYKQIDSYTTRSRRYPNEGAHTYVTPAGFEDIRNDLVAYTFFSGHEYGATRTQIRENHLYSIDPDGVEFLQKYFTRKDILVVYISATEETRKERLIKERGVEAAEKRIPHDRIKFAGFTDFDIQLINNDERDFLRNKMILRRLIRDWYNFEI